MDQELFVLRLRNPARGSTQQSATGERGFHNEARMSKDNEPPVRSVERQQRRPLQRANGARLPGKLRRLASASGRKNGRNHAKAAPGSAQRFGLSNEFSSDAGRNANWRAFLIRTGAAANVPADLDKVVDKIRSLVLTPLGAARLDAP
jgi:hypothetical protein